MKKTDFTLKVIWWVVIVVIIVAIAAVIVMATVNYFFVRDSISCFLEHENISDKHLQKYTFNSNTITFLISLIFGLIVSIVIGSQISLRKEIDSHEKELKGSQKALTEANKILERREAALEQREEALKKALEQREEALKKALEQREERLLPIERFCDIYVRTHIVYLESSILKQSLSASKQVLTSETAEFIYSVFRKTRSILVEIDKENIKTIPKNYQWKLVATIDDAITTIGFQKVYSEPKNNGKTGYLKSLEEELNTLRKRISDMKAADS